MSGVGCGFCLWLFLDFSVYLFECKHQTHRFMTFFLTLILQDLHQNFTNNPPVICNPCPHWAGDSGDIAGLKCKVFELSIIPQCHGMAVFESVPKPAEVIHIYLPGFEQGFYHKNIAAEPGIYLGFAKRKVNIPAISNAPYVQCYK